MSCVLNIAGRKLNIDEFIRESGLKGFVKRYRLKDVTSKSRVAKQYSYVAATISRADSENFEGQIRGAIAYLKKNKKKLAFIGTTKEVEYATINFLVYLKSVSKEYFVQKLYVPQELTMLCGSLNIGIEIAIVH